MNEAIVVDEDRRIWAEELADIVPSRVFDAHAHVFDLAFYRDSDQEKLPFFGRVPKVTFGNLQAYAAALFPDREFHFLICGSPRTNCDIAGLHAFVASEKANDPESIALMLAQPHLTSREIEETLDRYGFRGFKPYMCFSTNPDKSQSTVIEMLPLPYWEIANERELIMLIHLGRHKALADPENQRQIHDLAERFPRARVQLAHCGRCFTPRIAEEGLPRVASIPNVHVDTSAVCETEVFHILFDVWPLERIVFGTDMAPACITRGKYVAFGLGWYGVYEHNTEAFKNPHVPFRPTFIGYENLRAIRAAVRRRGWGKTKLEDLFLNNARRLLGLERSNEANPSNGRTS